MGGENVSVPLHELCVLDKPIVIKTNIFKTVENIIFNLSIFCVDKKISTNPVKGVQTSLKHEWVNFYTGLNEWVI